MPGIAHGRASVSGSRAYGWNVFGSLANSTGIFGSFSTSGTSHGSDPMPRYPSERKITGVRYLIAIRHASIAMSKQSADVAGATIATGDSPLRPKSACSRSACSVFVGMPVLGPARCTSITTSGSSTITARFIASLLSAMPGPELAVSPSAPPYDAPIAAPIAAISSSAWNARTPKFL